ncbi:MAG: VWA domain-containing protein [Bacteroidota bacterium]
MRLFIGLYLFISSSLLWGQIKVDKTSYDFGNLEAYDNRFVDFVFKNQGAKKEYVLSVRKPSDVNYIFTGNSIEKDSSIILRFNITPKQKGKFSYDVEVLLSDRTEGVKLKIAGFLKELPQDDATFLTGCPNFNDQPSQLANNFDLTVVTIDKETKQELAKSSVSMIQNGSPVWSHETDKNGKIKEEGVIGFNYFYATHDLYKPAELGAYVNFKRNYIVIELEKDPTQCLPVPIPAPEPPVLAQEPPTKEPEIEVPIIDLDQQLSNEPADIPIALSSLDPNNFSEEYFSRVNVCFVLDVSSSMNEGEKLELMKYSLNQLTEMIRPTDKISFVTYSSDARVLLSPTSGDQKDKIKKEIESLKASGLTAGGKGIKLGYQLAARAKISDGTNQVIIITDGAFNRYSDDYLKYVKKYRKKGINLSVVGISIKTPDKDKMLEATNNGGGNLVEIYKLADAMNNLKQEIRLISFKR